MKFKEMIRYTCRCNLVWSCELDVDRFCFIDLYCWRRDDAVLFRFIAAALSFAAFSTEFDLSNWSSLDDFSSLLSFNNIDSGTILFTLILLFSLLLFVLTLLILIRVLFELFVALRPLIAEALLLSSCACCDDLFFAGLAVDEEADWYNPTLLSLDSELFFRCTSTLRSKKDSFIIIYFFNLKFFFKENIISKKRKEKVVFLLLTYRTSYLFLIIDRNCAICTTDFVTVVFRCSRGQINGGCFDNCVQYLHFNSSVILATIGKNETSYSVWKTRNQKTTYPDVSRWIFRLLLLLLIPLLLSFFRFVSDKVRARSYILCNDKLTSFSVVIRNPVIEQ